MANNPILLHLSVFLVLLIIQPLVTCSPRSGLNVLCPEVQVETCTPAAQQPAHCHCPCPCCPPELACHYRRMCPYYTPFPFFPPPAAPSYCVQSVVVGGREDCKKNKTSVVLKKPEPKPQPPVLPPIPPLPLPPPPPPYIPPPTTRPRTTVCHHHKYEVYIEKLLKMLKERCEDPCEEPPLMVVAPKRRKVRKKKKYRLTTIEEDCSPLVLVKDDCRSEEDDDCPTYIIKHKKCCRPCIKSSCRTAILHED